MILKVLILVQKLVSEIEFYENFDDWQLRLQFRKGYGRHHNWTWLKNRVETELSYFNASFGLKLTLSKFWQKRPLQLGFETTILR